MERSRRIVRAVALLSFAAFVSYYFLLACGLTPVETELKTYPLVALRSRTNLYGKLSGGAFLIFASVKGELGERLVYRCFIKREDGEIEYREFDAASVTLVEKAGEVPRLEHFTTIRHRLFGVSCLIAEKYRFVVPPSSIVDRTIHISLAEEEKK